MVADADALEAIADSGIDDRDGGTLKASSLRTWMQQSWLIWSFA